VFFVTNKLDKKGTKIRFVYRDFLTLSPYFPYMFHETKKAPGGGDP